MIRILTFLFTLLTVSAFAQQSQQKHFSISKGATVNMREETQDWDVSIVNFEAPQPGINELKAELHRKKLEIMERYPASASGSARIANAEAPIVAANFEGNSFQGIPNDNDMAISNDSMIVSVTNRRIHIYNAVTEEQLAVKSLANLSQPLSISGSKFDPKVVYDSHNDRFVMVFLNGFTWETSQIIVAFSQTSNPLEDWNLYALPGNPLENETWSDYPVIGISGKDLYIGINTFTNGSANNSGFTETCLWQIDLRRGYLGFDLATNYYHDILPQGKAIFNITPISSSDETDASNMFLLSNRNTDLQNDTVFVLEVTGRTSDPTTELVVRYARTDQPYILPVPARQAANQWFDTNDSRVLGGYVHNGRIHYVQSCTDPETGTSAIYYGLIEDPQGAPLISTRIYSDPNLYYGYPNISWSGLTQDDEQSIISFNHSSFTEFAGFSAIHVNGQLEASPRVQIKTGLALVNVLSDTLERWGDYSGSQRVFDEPGNVWAVGSFGNQSNGHGTWLAQLQSPSLQTGIANQSSIRISPKTFPNPFNSAIEVEFELKESKLVRLELVDASGKMLQLFVEDRLKAGKNRLSFNGAFLSAGTYFLNAYYKNELMFSQKLIKQ